MPTFGRPTSAITGSIGYQVLSAARRSARNPLPAGGATRQAGRLRSRQPGVRPARSAMADRGASTVRRTPAECRRTTQLSGGGVFDRLRRGQCNRRALERAHLAFVIDHEHTIARARSAAGSRARRPLPRGPAKFAVALVEPVHVALEVRHDDGVVGHDRRRQAAMCEALLAPLPRCPSRDAGPRPRLPRSRRRRSPSPPRDRDSSTHPAPTRSGRSRARASRRVPGIRRRTRCPERPSPPSRCRRVRSSSVLPCAGATVVSQSSEPSFSDVSATTLPLSNPQMTASPEITGSDVPRSDEARHLLLVVPHFLAGLRTRARAACRRRYARRQPSPTPPAPTAPRRSP